MKTQRVSRSCLALFAASAMTLGALQTHASPTQLDMAAINVPFIANDGQIPDSGVKFYAHTFGGTVYVNADGAIVYSLPKMEATDRSSDESPAYTVTAVGTLKETLVDARAAAVSGKVKSETVVNYFVGNDPKSWRANIASFTCVGLGEVYDRIELELTAHADNVEKIFTVKPGGNPGKIQLTMDGAESLAIDESGCLVVKTALGDVRFSAPVAYQLLDGKRVGVAAHYSISAAVNTYGFEVASYDGTRDLVIDPVLASTFFGSINNITASSDRGFDIALDGDMNVYVLGFVGAGSTNFPMVPGSYCVTNSGGGRCSCSEAEQKSKHPPGIHLPGWKQY